MNQWQQFHHSISRQLEICAQYSKMKPRKLQNEDKNAWNCDSLHRENTSQLHPVQTTKEKQNN